MQNTITRNTSAAKLKLAAANASAALALDATQPTGYRAIVIKLNGHGNGPALPPTPLGLAIECVRSGLKLQPQQFSAAKVAAKQLRVDAFDGDLAAQHIDDVVFWWKAHRPGITPQGRALVRLSGHLTEHGQPACGVRQPQPCVRAASRIVCAAHWLRLCPCAAAAMAAAS